MDREELVVAIDAHLRTLRKADTQATAVEWMKRAHELLGQSAQELEKKVYALPSFSGPPTFVLTPPKPLALVAGGLSKPPPVWLQGQTVAYENRTQAWTSKDTRRLEAEVAARRRAAAEGKLTWKKTVATIPKDAA